MKNPNHGVYDIKARFVDDLLVACNECGRTLKIDLKNPEQREIVAKGNIWATHKTPWFYLEDDTRLDIFTDYLVTLSRMSDQTEIYTISNKNTQEKMKIAVRGCVLV